MTMQGFFQSTADSITRQMTAANAIPRNSLPADCSRDLGHWPQTRHKAGIAGCRTCFMIPSMALDGPKTSAFI
jgi:hypothetical protein